MRGKKYIGLSILVLMVLIMTACSAGNEDVLTETSMEVDSSDTLQLSQEENNSSVTEHIRIIHINDVHTHVEENDTAIGYPKIAGFIEQEKAANPNLIVLDAGDTFVGTSSSGFDKGESMVPLLNTIGFDVMAAGNADFCFGKEALEGFMKGLNYPILCGNMRLAGGTEFFDGTTVITLENGRKVGIFSVTALESMRYVSGVFEYVEPVELCKSFVKTLSEEVDIIVALLHLGDLEADVVNSDMIAREVPGINLIVDGHSHTVLEDGKIVNDVLIAQAGEFSKYVGVIDLIIEDGKMVQSTANLLTKDDLTDMPEKEETALALKDLVEKREAYSSEIIGQTEVELIGERNTIRTQETNVGNMAADAAREAAEAEIAILPASIIGGELMPGDITKGDALNIARVSNMIIKKEMKGRNITALLSHAFRAYPEPATDFVQVSGISVVFDPAREENRVLEVTVNGKIMEDEQSYIVALGIGISEEPGAVDGVYLEDVGEWSDIMTEYIITHSPIKPIVEGRIKVK